MNQSWDLPEWKGSRSQRFYGGRKPLEHHDQLTSFLSQYQTNKEKGKGIRTYEKSLSPQQKDFKPALKVFPDSYYFSSKEIDRRGRKHVNLQDQKQRIRPERSHVEGGKETDFKQDLTGIRTYEEANQSRNLVFSLEKQFQTKKKIYGLQCQRDHLTRSYLGNKPYKTPQYSPNFFKDGGLIIGSTNKFQRPASELSDYNFDSMKKSNYNSKAKMREYEEDRNLVTSLDNWEKTVLEEENRSRHNPETIYERKGGKEKGGK